MQVSFHEWRVSIEFYLYSILISCVVKCPEYFFWFSVTALLLFPQTLLTVYWRWLNFYFYCCCIRWLFNPGVCLIGTFKSFVSAWWRQSHYWIWEWAHKVSCIRWEGTHPNFESRSPFFFFFIPPFLVLTFLFLLTFCSLLGILPNRVIQPLAEHSEYPIECLGTVHISSSIEALY